MVFNEAIARINPELGSKDVTRLLADVKLHDQKSMPRSG